MSNISEYSKLNNINIKNFGPALISNNVRKEGFVQVHFGGKEAAKPFTSISNTRGSMYKKLKE